MHTDWCKIDSIKQLDYELEISIMWLLTRAVNYHAETSRANDLIVLV